MNLTVEEIITSSADKMEFAIWLNEERFIDIENISCGVCGEELQLALREAEPDGVCLRCPKGNCRRIYSIRQGSFFFGRNLPIARILVIMKQFQGLEAIASTARLIGVSANTVSAYFKELRELINADLELNPIQYFLPGVYEVDETYYEHIKIDQGHAVQKQWIAGFLHRDTGKIKIYTVDDRKRASLLPPLLAGIPPQSVVFSDELRAYRVLQTTHVHRTVNHSAGDYSHPDNIPGLGEVSVHVNGMEGVWNSLKNLIANHQCRTLPYLSDYMNMLMFFSDNRNIFELIKINLDA